MVGTRPLDELRSQVEAAGAKLVLVGDNRQLSSIDAGGALRTLASELGDHVVTLTTNRRQAGADQQWERDALVTLREGTSAPAVHAYADHGRITLARDIDEARHRIIEDWWAVHRDPYCPTTPSWPCAGPTWPPSTSWPGPAVRPAANSVEEFRLGEKTFSVGDRVIFERNQRVQRRTD